MKIILMCAVATMASACGGTAPGRGKQQVVAAFYPLAYAAQRLGGSNVEVHNLTPPGAEPHDLEVSPSEVQLIRSAHLVLLLGHGFQPQLEASAGSGARVLRLLDTPGLALHANRDPHFWLDPLRYARIVQRIAGALHRESASARFVAQLRGLDRAFRQGLSRCARHDIVTSHEAFAYLAQRYGLKQVAITGLSPEAEPAPKNLARVVQLVRRTGATTVFFETLVSPRIADTVARETGARTAVLNPIEGLTPAEVKRGDDYFSLMRANLANLRRALGCR